MDEEDPPPSDTRTQWWYPRQLLRRTNWLYRVDALRGFDRREMQRLWDLAEQMLHLTTQSMAWVITLQSFLHTATNSSFITHIHEMTELLTDLSLLLWSEGYCYYLSFLEIAYYREGSRALLRGGGSRFGAILNSEIATLVETEAYRLTGFSKASLRRIFIHLRIPGSLIIPRRFRFTGEECFLHYLYWNRNGGTKLQMAREFGGDPRRFSHSIRLVMDHVYNNFYNKISGDSMRAWLPQVEEFRRAIWEKLRSGVTREEVLTEEALGESSERYVFLDIPFESFRIFSFLDDTGFRTTSPGGSVTREYGFYDDVQRAFYSGYFAGHGLKAQVLSLPNGMIGSIFVSSIRNSDSGILNLSGLNEYLEGLFGFAGMQMAGANNQYPAVYADGIFPQLSCIVASRRNGSERAQRIATRMSAVRQCIEHLFAFHYNIFKLFRQPEQFRLLVTGVQVYKLIFNSFFLWNVYQTIYQTSTYFCCAPPSLEEYLPLDETLIPAPAVTDAELGEVYNYFV